jgi:drug/metabolite transporter (DMT)-like permease
MKLLGVACGAIGVCLLTYADGPNPTAHANALWLFAGIFIVAGFVVFIRKWDM